MSSGEVNFTVKEIPLHQIDFTHDPGLRFQDRRGVPIPQNVRGREVSDVANDLKTGKLKVEDIEIINVVDLHPTPHRGCHGEWHHHEFYSVDNRRLMAFKEAFPFKENPDKLIKVRLFNYERAGCAISQEYRDKRHGSRN